MLFNDNWSFLKENKTNMISLPHTWNNFDGQIGAKNYVKGKTNTDYWRGVCEYEKVFYLGDEYFDKQLFLLFEGVNTIAKIFVNDKFVFEHRGGYTAFKVDITNYILINSSNKIRVVVDNRKYESIAPIDADFTFFGGIYRNVHLISKEKIFFSNEELSYKPIKFVQKQVNGKYAEFEIHTFICNKTNSKKYANIICNIFHNDELICSKENKISINTDLTELNKYHFIIEKPHLWNGIYDPFRYKVEVILQVDKKTIDIQQDYIGLRYYNVYKNKGFYLNGKSYPLRGVSRHQDRQNLGNAITEKEHNEDMNLILDIGANSVRLAHYPQSNYFYDLCDRNGIIVWAEIPFIDFIGGKGSFNKPDKDRKEFFTNVKQQLKEMIRQNINHPSICFWGLQNEVNYKFHFVMKPFMNELYKIAKQEDNSRLVTQAVNTPVAHSWSSDIYGWNYYPGWYSGNRWSMAIFAPLIQLLFKKPLAFSEYGAGGSTKQHTKSLKKVPPFGNWHPEEYQSFCHEADIKVINKCNFLWATYVWNMFDFGSNRRHEGADYGINDKGLVTYDRQTKKDAFYLYKSYWSDQPFVHICSKAIKKITSNKTNIKIYTNKPHIDLYINNKFFKSINSKNVFVFNNVPLQIGENLISAKSGIYDDKTTIIFNLE